MTPLDPAALRRPVPGARAHRRGRPAGRLRGCAGRLAGPGDGDRRDRRTICARDQQHARRVRGQRGDRRADRRRPPRGGRHHGRRPGRDRLRAELHDVAAAPLPVVRTHAAAGRRGRRHDARPRRERPSVGAGGAGRRRHGPLGGHPRRRRDARPRFVRRRAQRPDAAGRVHARRRTRWARSRRRPSSSGASTPSERSPPSTACTSPSIARSTSTRSDADILACSPYKFFGPHLGVLGVRRELLDTWTPYKLASGAGRGARPLGDRHAEPRGTRGIDRRGRLPGRRRPDLRRAGRAGSTGRGRRRLRRDRRARARARGAVPPGSGRRPGPPSLGHRRTRTALDERTPTFAVRLGDQDPLKTATELAQRGIYVWDGHYYAITVMERLGLLDSGGAVRIGFCHYHSADDVDRVLEALADLA